MADTQSTDTGGPVTVRSFRPDVFDAAAPALIAACCTTCGRRSFPARDVCPSCGATDAKPARLSGDGVVYSYTVVRQAPPGLTVPYVLGYVDLPADDVRVMARIEGLEPEQVEIGLPVRLVSRPVDPPDDAGDVVMFAFRHDPDQEGTR